MSNLAVSKLRQKLNDKGIIEQVGFSQKNYGTFFKKSVDKSGIMLYNYIRC